MNAHAGSVAPPPAAAPAARPAHPTLAALHDILSTLDEAADQGADIDQVLDLLTSTRTTTPKAPAARTSQKHTCVVQGCPALLPPSRVLCKVHKDCQTVNADTQVTQLLALASEGHENAMALLEAAGRGLRMRPANREDWDTWLALDLSGAKHAHTLVHGDGVDRKLVRYDLSPVYKRHHANTATLLTALDLYDTWFTDTPTTIAERDTLMTLVHESANEDTPLNFASAVEAVRWVRALLA